jgi:CheY-like chemotaxis protein
MVELDLRLSVALACVMERPLIVDPSASNAEHLGAMLSDIWPCMPWTASSVQEALQVAADIDPKLIIVEHSAGLLDGLEFCRTLRRSDLSCRKAPVVMIAAQATSDLIIRARDAGVYTFLGRPYTLKDLVRRLAVISMQPRDWIEANEYVGPDRRLFTSSKPGSLHRRRRGEAPADPNLARIVLSLRVLDKALTMIEFDPGQAKRLLHSQAIELGRLGSLIGASNLARSAVHLQAHMKGVNAGAKLDRARVEPIVGTLMSSMTQVVRAAA